MKKLLVTVLTISLLISCVACTENNDSNIDSSLDSTENSQSFNSQTENSVKTMKETVEWQEFNFEKVVDESEIIVRATIAERGDAIEIEKKHYTKITVDVQDIIKGENVADTLDILQYGGDFGDEIYVIENAPVYEVEQEYIFFLKKYKNEILTVEEYENYAGIPTASQAVLVENDNISTKNILLPNNETVESETISTEEYVKYINQTMADVFKYSMDNIEMFYGNYPEYPQYPITDKAVIEQICKYFEDMTITDETFSFEGYSSIGKPFKFCLENSNIEYTLEVIDFNKDYFTFISYFDFENRADKEEYILYRLENPIELLDYTNYYLSEAYKTFGDNKPEEAKQVLVISTADQIYDLSTAVPKKAEFADAQSFANLQKYINALELNETYALQITGSGAGSICKFADTNTGNEFNVSIFYQQYLVSPTSDQVENVYFVSLNDNNEEAKNYAYVIDLEVYEDIEKLLADCN